MAVIVQEKQYELPEEGQYLAVVADVVDLGVVTGQFGPKERVQVVFLLDGINSQGENFRISGFYNKSLHEKATLRKTLKAILRREVTGSFDMDEIIGTTVGLVIEHNDGTDGKTYANIQAIIPAPKGQRMEIPADFQRQVEKDGTGTTDNPAVKKDAKKATAKPTFAKAAPTQTVSDEDIPF